MVRMLEATPAPAMGRGELLGSPGTKPHGGACFGEFDCARKQWARFAYFAPPPKKGAVGEERSGLHERHLTFGAQCDGVNKEGLSLDGVAAPFGKGRLA
jgi:hypothetical protein